MRIGTKEDLERLERLEGLLLALAVLSGELQGKTNVEQGVLIDSLLAHAVVAWDAIHSIDGEIDDKINAAKLGRVNNLLDKIGEMAQLLNGMVRAKSTLG